jgi:hypothetical protein
MVSANTIVINAISTTRKFYENRRSQLSALVIYKYIKKCKLIVFLFLESKCSSKVAVKLTARMLVNHLVSM